MCQEIRTYQNKISFVLVSLVGVAYMFSLWTRTNSSALLIWYVTFSCLTVVRALLYESVRKALDTASPAELIHNEISLVCSGIVVSLVLGMSYWIVAIPGDERTVLIITVLNCVYATGATINAATQTRILLVYLIAILGQGFLFWIGIGNRTDYAMALLLACLFVLLYGFAMRNRALIVESVQMRLQNKAHNARLIENRVLVENSLKSALEANRSKSHFIATVSHDMAQPIHALTFLLESLKSAINNDRTRSGIVEKIESSVGLLERQFSGFVDLSRYDASDLQVQRNQFDLMAVCQILVENVEAKAAKKNIEVKLHGQSAVVISDSVLIGRILSNLLDNAIKYSNGGQVHLRLTVRDAWEVKDSGIGIKREDLPRIFGDFVQLNNQSQPNATGAGLGLSIVERVADMLGIEVYVDSTVGEGTVFTLLVPAKQTSELPDDRIVDAVEGLSIKEIVSSGASMAVPRIKLRGKVILLVDDESANTDALAGYINDLGGESISAATVDDSMLLARTHAIDLAIVDDWLDSVPSGLTLSRKLASLLGEDRVVMVTANDSKRRLREIEEAGFSVYSKPLTGPQLQAVLSARLGIGLT